MGISDRDSRDGSSAWMIYGATGFTGELIARETADRRMKPVLAGRNGLKVRALAESLNLPFRAFDLSDPAAVRNGLAGLSLVLHCAGPFVHTAQAMVEACLESGVDYLDITGEIPVLEYLGSLDASAKERGCVLLPGVGFDVVPTDCLALKLKKELPMATHLLLAMDAGTEQSPGTAKSTVEAVVRGSAVRRDGMLIPEKHVSVIRRMLIGGRRRWVMRVPWGDLVSAYRATGIPNIETYMATSLSAIVLMRLIRPMTWILRSGAVRRAAFRIIDRTTNGPDADRRSRFRTTIRGEVWDDAGRRKTMEISTPEAYAFTALSAVEAVSRVLRGEVAPGCWTPAEVFGCDLMHSLPGVEILR